MERNIIDSLIKHLDSIFPDYPIHDDLASQDVRRPAFFISRISEHFINGIIGLDYFIIYGFELILDPGIEDPETKINEIMPVLMPSLRRFKKIDLPGSWRPWDIQVTVLDSIVHITFTVTASFRDERDEPFIRDIDIKTEVNKNHMNTDSKRPKHAILACNEFVDYINVLRALLKDDEFYTLDEVREIIREFVNKEVN